MPVFAMASRFFIPDFLLVKYEYMCYYIESLGLSEEEKTMLDSLDQIVTLLENYQFDLLELEEREIPASAKKAFMLGLERSQALDVWQWMRSLTAQTGHYPLLVEDWGDDREFFFTGYFEYEQQTGMIPDIAPEAIIAATPHIDLETFLQNQEAMPHSELLEALEWMSDATQKQFGSCPSHAELVALVNQEQIKSELELERYLFNWERRTFGDAQALVPIDTSYLDWYDTSTYPSIMLLLPVTEGWNTLAYLHWYGAGNCGTPLTIEILQKWHREYQADLVCNYGTMLQFLVGKRPTTPEIAFQLAWEQIALASCTTVPLGVSIRDHARALLALDRWFIHERP
jgi:hypothetical protein